MHRSKRKKTTDNSYTIFLRLLELKKKERFRIFTRTFKRFAAAAKSEDAIAQLSKDIENITNARKSCLRLIEQKLYDPTFKFLRDD